MGDYSLMCDK